MQSHLSDNDEEVAWVRKLHPDCDQYWQTYAKFGLWNERTLMAHCVRSDERERKAIKDAGVTVVHCAGELTAAERFEHCVYLRQRDAIREVWSAGRKVFSAP